MIRIGTRGSDLALWQANHVADLIGRERVNIIVIKTKGDRIVNVSFDKMEGKGFFTKEIEEALLSREIDLAVHSMKDLPTENTPGLAIAAVMRREDPSDVLLVRAERYMRAGELPLAEGAIVGTSSLRRAAQLLNIMPSLEVRPLRGNVPTRVRRLREERFDAIVLARAGLSRLGLDTSGLVEFILPFSYFLPAPAQGALAIQVREGDAELHQSLRSLNDAETEMAVETERHFLEHFGGGCHVPLGALAYRSGGMLRLSGLVASVDGKRLIRKSIDGDDPALLGRRLADMLKEEGAGGLI
ncbi:MAG TPA: hydroxymethylbilane synthase [Spirochaetota bacterium]|jgi:hydroxymethylbilane synthase|nr:hydroxymethylbilane synthase [Spirochaetota bacterium]OPZ36323.1 MAG: Porphobilinogen deaminase [Spirochaetes bacterium ADurb.BinA120]HNU92609.1 hydroxymethylbilane synthase [Spirochaetota bacterium]HPI14337.1 hydroxymethylbilane synthase [Spirochaetota bacterium]HPO45181.1 hydroxymethylbilane synthase [Spirochaetota bacterium]